MRKLDVIYPFFQNSGLCRNFSCELHSNYFDLKCLRLYCSFLFILFFLELTPVWCSDNKPADLSKEKLYFSVGEALLNKQKAFKLCLGGQEIITLQDDIGDLTCLMEINLSQNKIEKLPESFCRLKNLTELKIPGNMFKNLPECISEFNNLKTLDVSNNPDLDKKNLFNIIYKLNNLESLDISYLELNEIPQGIENLKNLKDLNISGNNLSAKQIENLKKILPKTLINS